MSEDTRAPAEPRTLVAEAARIRWRRALLDTPDGLAWLTAQARAGAKCRDLGPHRTDAPEVTP